MILACVSTIHILVLRAPFILHYRHNSMKLCLLTQSMSAKFILLLNTGREVNPLGEVGEQLVVETLHPVGVTTLQLLFHIFRLLLVKAIILELTRQKSSAYRYTKVPFKALSSS